ncbi:Alpha/beta hydrolase family protein [compost metagenome]
MHQSKLMTEGAILESLIHQLVQIDCPMLLIHGTSDLVTTDHQVEYFLHSGEKRIYVTIEESGHFPRFEQKKKYALEIKQFVVSLHTLK